MAGFDFYQNRVETSNNGEPAGVRRARPEGERFAEPAAAFPVEKPPRIIYNYGSAGVAELADARDSKSRGPKGSCGFDSLLRHALFLVYFWIFLEFLFPFFCSRLYVRIA
jgi:hypothetical protein